MKKYKNKKVNEKIVKRIECDFCSKKVKGVDRCLMSDITEFEINPGYGSSLDLESFKFDICDMCLKKLLKKKLC